MAAPARMDVVCLSSQDWNAHLTVPQQIMARVAADHRVLYIDPPRSLTSAALSGWVPPPPGEARHMDMAAARDVVRRSPPGRAVPIHNLPPVLSAAARRVNGLALRSWFRRTMAGEGIEAPVYWVFEPASVQHLPHLPPGPLIYDCIDLWAGYFPEGSRRHRNIAAMDLALATRADLVFVGSEMLRRLHEGKAGGPVHLQHHAADFALFNRAAAPDYPVAPALAERLTAGRTVVGLCGILDKRVDVGSLAAIAGRRPDWLLVLVGPVQRNLDIAALEACENVAMIGAVAPGELPGFVRGFDVCLIPYLIDDFVRGIYPLKLHEYLAAGKPVVSTPVPAVLQYADRIEIAEGADGIEAAILRALADDAPDRAAGRIALARANGWDVRVAEKLRIVRETFAR